MVAGQRGLDMCMTERQEASKGGQSITRHRDGGAVRLKSREAVPGMSL